MGARLLRGMEDLDLLHAPATPIVSNGEKVVVAQNVRGVFEYQVTPLASNRGQVLELRVATFSDSSGVSYRIIEGSELHDPSLPRKEGGYQPSFDSGDQVLVSELNQVDGLGRFYKDQPHFANSQDPQK